LAWASVADFAIAPMQDILGLNNEARMNVPGTVGNYNWQWRMQKEEVSEDTLRVLRFLTELFGRK
jgi:4-alpha-glucanotransferase